MTKPLIILLCLSLLFGCKGRSPGSNKAATVNQKTDSAQKGKLMDTTNLVDNGNPEPSFDEVKSELLERYNKIERIDTTIIVGSDTLHVHEKYYCLKDNAVILPKRYLWGGDTSKDFVTHSFATNIILIKNKDTIINKTFKKSDFDQVVNPEEQKYAIIMFPNFSGYSKKYDGVIFCYSITIPLTDVGVSACVVVSRNGHYQIFDEYAKID